MRRRRKTALAAIVTTGVLAGLAPGSAMAAAITGTVSDEVTHAGIAGVQVCPTPQPYTFEVDCVYTDSSGHYSLGLPPTQYMLSFSGAINNLPYVDEFYDNKVNNLDADLVTLSASDEVLQLDVELAQGGSIAGTLTDEETGEPVANMPACAWNTDTWRCDKSDDAGHYQVNGLPSGEFWVEYESWNLANYQHEYYEDGENLGSATKVAVVAPGVTTGIDAKLAKGAEILGHVYDVESGAPLYSVMVCAAEADEPHSGGCTWTEADGSYAIRGLPGGAYLVAFGTDHGPYTTGAGQWWNGVATIEEAEPVVIAPPESRSGIDGRLPSWYGSLPPGSEPAPRIEEGIGAPPPAPFLLPPLAPKAPLPKCKKGFHRKLVKGKKRCVRKHRRHHRARHRQHR